jgi:hypothetical protein
MTSDQSGLRAAGLWLAAASLLLVGALTFHGPLHPDLEVQMTRIAESASRWAAVHWTAAASLLLFCRRGRSRPGERLAAHEHW